MLETVVTKENGIRAAADGDVETLALFFRQFRDGDADGVKSVMASESPERPGTVPTVQWRELTTMLFREAIANGQLEVVRALLATQAVQDVYSDRVDKQRLLSKLLAWATREDYSDIVACLLSHGADPNALISADDDDGQDDDQDELPLLSLAARLGSVDIAQLLLEKGGSVNARSEYDGATALHEAARQDEREMIELLVRHGADVNAVDDANRETPLHVATKKGHRAAVEALLACRADTTRVNRHGSCVVHLARVEGHDPILRVLQAAGADTETPRAPTPRRK